MNALARLGAYVLGLLLLFAVATLVGRAVGPIGEPAPAHSSEHAGTVHTAELTVRAGSA